VKANWHLVDLLWWEPIGTVEHLGGSQWAVRGSARTFEVDTQAVTCTCGGTSQAFCPHLECLKASFSTLPRRCPACNGRGREKKDWKRITMDRWEEETPCAACEGTGKVEQARYRNLIHKETL